MARSAAGAARCPGREPGYTGRSVLSLKVRVLVIGRLKEDYLKAAEAEYIKRLAPYCKVAVEELRDEKALVDQVPPGALVIALDERGDMVTSAELARGILGGEAQSGGGRPIIFAVGGADGHSPALRKRADRCIAFGRMTIAHRLVRVLVLEQLYRAFTILRGHPYHR